VKMDNRTPIDQLNDAIEAIIAGRQPAASGADVVTADSTLAPLIGIASELRGLPAESFRTRLGSELLSSAANTDASDVVGATERRSDMSSQVKPVSQPSHRVIPYLCCRNAAAAIDFYREAFGAVEITRLQEPGGRIGHAEISIFNTPIMLADEYPELNILGPESLGGTGVMIHLEVDDVDAFAQRAVAAGARVIRPVEDQFYGDRSGKLADPFGHQWMVSTHKEDVSNEEMKRRFDSLMQEQAEAPVEPIPKGFHTVTPYLQVKGAARLLEFVKQAFNAEQELRVDLPDGTVMHAEIRIGDSPVEMADANDQYKETLGAMHLYVEDADAVYQRALAAGATSLHPPADQPYGDREASVRDPLGNHWYIATHKLGRGHAPEGFHTVTPFFHPRGADNFIDFVTRAFHAEVVGKHTSPDGTVLHAGVRIGDSMIELGEAHGQWTPIPSAIHLYVKDADSFYESALGAGATSLFKPRNEPYGDRVAGVTDPFENVWYIATHQKDVKFETKKEQPPLEKKRAKPIPEGYHTVTPYLVLPEANELIEFCKEAFGAIETFRTTGSAGGLHCEIRIGDSMVMVGGSPTSERKFPSAIYLYVEDVDAMYERALQAGATSMGPPTDRPYGDRNASVKDRFGNEWYIATHISDEIGRPS
jgi:PhnB protein